jgi:hypothetical protein
MMEQRLRLLKGGYTPASWTYSPAVPFVVSACIAFLRAKGAAHLYASCRLFVLRQSVKATHHSFAGGLTMEGIFRVSGFHESITKLRQFFNQGTHTSNRSTARSSPLIIFLSACRLQVL